MLDELRINEYAEAASNLLSNVDVPFDALNCDSSSCTVHTEAITAYYDEIIHSLKHASQLHIASKKRDHFHRAVPGWTEHVNEKHVLYGDVYSLWAMVGKPRDGYIYSQLRLARSQFKYALRFCLKKMKKHL